MVIPGPRGGIRDPDLALCAHHGSVGSRRVERDENPLNAPRTPRSLRMVRCIYGDVSNASLTVAGLRLITTR